jgi:phosphoesterase RecJ-like protein
VFRGVYESVELAKLRLLGNVLGHATAHEGGRVVVAHLTRSDFAEAGAEEPASEGLIDHLRAVEGSELVALIRELAPGGPRCKVSLRSSTDELDVSAIARQSGGGGHRQAAGFSSDLDVDGVRAFILDAYRRAIDQG